MKKQLLIRFSRVNSRGKRRLEDGGITADVTQTGDRMVATVSEPTRTGEQRINILFDVSRGMYAELEAKGYVTELTDPWSMPA